MGRGTHLEASRLPTLSRILMSNKRTIPTSELIINGDGSVFHLHLRPEQLADRVFLVGDPARVDMVASRFESIECNVSSREFHTITGSYKGKRISIVSHGIGTDNIDIVLNELDALANIDFETRQEKDTFRPAHPRTRRHLGRTAGRRLLSAPTLQPSTPSASTV